MSAVHVAAVDLGAESGRVADVSFDGSRLRLRVVNRFSHVPSRRDGILRWDFDGLWAGIQEGLAQLAAGDAPVASVGVDTWGVDYGLVAADGSLVDAPTCYRDPRQAEAHDRVLRSIPRDDVYCATGVQIMPINTMFALASDVTDHPGRLERASTLLMLPDVFHHLLAGSRVTEFTAASTTGLYDMAERAWATPLIEQLGIPAYLFPAVVEPGTDVGELLPTLAAGHLSGARVIVPPGHDTASAVVATPTARPHDLYISSGTWSLCGVETPAPVISEYTRQANITNEGGYAGANRLLRNVAGLWILQAARRQWAAAGTQWSYPDLVKAAHAQPPLRSIINPDARDFLDGQDAVNRITAYCAATGSQVPAGKGAIVRCILESLALAYRHVVEDITTATSIRPEAVHIVGGGSNNALLSQLTADATGLPVHCGPVEATALGNAAVQLVAAGELSGADDIRRAVAASTAITTYEPNARRDDWERAYERFITLVERDHAS